MFFRWVVRSCCYFEILPFPFAFLTDIGALCYLCGRSNGAVSYSITERLANATIFFCDGKVAMDGGPACVY
jgi:hypothetical protein